MNPRRALTQLTALFMAAIGNPELARDTFSKLRHRNRRSARHVRRLDGNVLQHVTAQSIIDQLSKQLPIIALKQDPHCMKVGVADVDFHTTLKALLVALPAARIYFDGGAKKVKHASLLRKARGAKIITFLYRDHNSILNQIEIESFQQRTPTLWVSANTLNSEGRALFQPAFAAAGLCDITDFTVGPTLAAVRTKMPVDVVFTWVNHSDPHWQSIYAEHVKTDKSLSDDAKSLSRFHNRDELRYALRSVEDHLPWTRQIFIVSNCAPPQWLATHPKIIWVPHELIISDEYLPTFNSHVIESCLHKIPDLSDNFIYLNDDMFVCRRMEKVGFFEPNGMSRAFLKDYGMVTGVPYVGAPDYLNASRNSAQLIHDHFGYVPTQLHKHAPYALNKSLLTEIEAQFSKAIHQTRSNRFRTIYDINITSFLYHHYAYAKRRAIFAPGNSVLVRNTDLRWRIELEQTRENGCTFLCINEGGRAPLAEDWKVVTMQFLNHAFPHAAPWET